MNVFLDAVLCTPFKCLPSTSSILDTAIPLHCALWFLGCSHIPLKTHLTPLATISGPGIRQHDPNLVSQIPSPAIWRREQRGEFPSIHLDGQGLLATTLHFWIEAWRKVGCSRAKMELTGERGREKQSRQGFPQGSLPFLNRSQLTGAMGCSNPSVTSSYFILSFLA